MSDSCSQPWIRVRRMPLRIIRFLKRLVLVPQLCDYVLRHLFEGEAIKLSKRPLSLQRSTGGTSSDGPQNTSNERSLKNVPKAGTPIPQRSACLQDPRFRMPGE